MICELEAQHNEARGSLRHRRDRAPGPPTASGRPRDRRLHDRPTVAPRVTRSSSSRANVSGIPPLHPGDGTVETFLRGIAARLGRDYKRPYALVYRTADTEIAVATTGAVLAL
jgi:hypothetical protein